MDRLRPASAFLPKTPKAQLEKIREELEEVEEALDAYMKETENIMKWGRLAEEIADVQFAAETMLACIGLKREGRDAIRAKVDAKNKKRGYYKTKPF